MILKSGLVPLFFVLSQAVKAAVFNSDFDYVVFQKTLKTANPGSH